VRHARGQAGNDFAKTNKAGEFTLQHMPTAYSPGYCTVGEQYKAKDIRIVSRNPLVLQLSAGEK